MTYTDIAIYAHRSDRSLPVFAGNTLTFDGDTVCMTISISKNISSTIIRLRNYRKIPALLGQATDMISKCLESKISVRTEELS